MLSLSAAVLFLSLACDADEEAPRPIPRPHLSQVDELMVSLMVGSFSQRELVPADEPVLAQVIIALHKRAKATRNDALYELTAQLYAVYLARFPEGDRAYDMRFFYAELLNDNLERYGEAAEQYTRVLLARPQGKWSKNAAYDAVLAYDELARRVPPPTTVSGTRVSMLQEEEHLLAAIDRYLEYLPDGAEAPQVAFRGASLLYRYGRDGEAGLRFQTLIERYPEAKFDTGESVPELAARLWLDLLHEQGDKAAWLDLARRFRSNPILSKGEFGDELRRILGEPVLVTRENPRDEEQSSGVRALGERGRQPQVGRVVVDVKDGGLHGFPQARRGGTLSPREPRRQ